MEIKQPLQNKCVIVGITGGIAAYKVCSLVSSLKKQGCEVHVLMTKEAEQFITPLTLQTLSGQKVITDMFSVDYTPDVHHISLAKKADVFVIAPATANIIAKVSNGIADDMLTTTFLAATCPKLIVPAMNTNMLMNPITQDNLAKCRHYGMHVLESDAGYLACGDVGSGRMPEPKEIEDAVKELLVTDKYLTGKKILITAGPTQEAIDPVRYITNHSTGKMGYALARAARNAGAQVILVAGKNALAPVEGVETISVVSAKEMADAVLARQAECDAMILSAAVADYTPVETAEEKIHKGDGNLSIECKRTTDILATLGQKKQPGQILIGFSMETENMIERTKEKLQKKNCDYIVGNNLKEKGAGFGTDTNHTVIIAKDRQMDLGLLSKEDTAAEILRQCLKENA
jgi:phosphopantothenoylcysteine decarboxylase/phosphopantothenate--cysteine ligase, prokaryotic